jgi:hypothetical protein
MFRSRELGYCSQFHDQSITIPCIRQLLANGERERFPVFNLEVMASAGIKKPSGVSNAGNCSVVAPRRY